MQETWVLSLSWEDPLEEGLTTYSSILAWRIPWTEELSGLQSMGSQRVGHDWATNTGGCPAFMVETRGGVDAARWRPWCWLGLGICFWDGLCSSCFCAPPHLIPLGSP